MAAMTSCGKGPYIVLEEQYKLIQVVIEFMTEYHNSCQISHKYWIYRKHSGENQRHQLFLDRQQTVLSGLWSQLT